MIRLLACVLLLQSTPDLVGHWKLDGTANDGSGSGLHGSLVGGPTWTPGRIGQALQFDGVTDSVSVPDSPALRLTGDLTIAFWMRKDREASDWQRLVGKGDAVARNYGVWEWVGAPGHILFQQYDASGNAILNLTSAAQVPIGKWTHVTAL